MVMTALERWGLRRFHLFVCRVTGEHSLPSLADASTAVMPVVKVDELRGNARYFGSANFWRSLFHLPVVLMFWQFGATGFAGFFAILILLHSVLMVHEAYKASVVALIKAEERDVEPMGPVTSEVWWDAYYRPKPWETEALYRVFGVFAFRDLVEYVIDVLTLTKAERLAGKRVEYVGKGTNEVVAFENGSRVSELVHLSMAAIDLVPIVFVLANQLWLALPFTLFIFWGDFYCALLQRLNRHRIWPLILRLRKVAARAKERSS